MTSTLIAPPGLKGLVVADTKVGDVRGSEGFYHYRQYPADELAATHSFEALWKLLVDGELPGDAALAAFRDEVRALRSLPEALSTLVEPIAAASRDPLDGLRAMVPLVGAHAAMAPTVDAPPAERRAGVLRIAAAVPTILAAVYRARQGEAPIAPDPTLGHAENFYAMVTGARPRPEHTRALETYLNATIDHGFNASTFTARVIASTGADVAAAISGAIGALSGPLHGGAPSRALQMIEDIAAPQNTEDYLRAALARGDKIMGFGHAVYKTEDPRSRLLKSVALGLGGPLVELAVEIEPRIVAFMQGAKPDATIQTNVEYYASVVLELCGLPREMFTPAFNVSRVVGWGAHILEQAAGNKIMRPSARYVGLPVAAAVAQ